MSATDTLEQARQARRTGDLSACLSHASAAVADAESERTPDVAYHAHACLGRLYVSRMEPHKALSCFQGALAVAQRHGLTEWLAPAYHDMYVAGKEAGVVGARRTWGAKAFDLYRERNPKSPQITGLLADFAEEVMYQHPGCRDSAAHTVQAWRVVPVSMPHPRFHMAAAANIMYASALLGLRSRFEAAAVALEIVFHGLPHHEHAARNLAHAALAATMIRDYPKAVELAALGAEISAERAEYNVLRWAEEVRAAALAERAATC